MKILNAGIINNVTKLVKRMIMDRDKYSEEFNTPIKFSRGDWFVNERIVEVFFVHRNLPLDGTGLTVLEFGCTKSSLALELASLGYKVTGLDLREYRYSHPNLTKIKGNLLNYQPERPFDIITAISVIEHIGLGAYGEEPDDEALERVVNKLLAVLKPGGKLIFTAPIGSPYHDSFLRTFTSDDIKQIFKRRNLTLIGERYFKRTQLKFWFPCTVDEANSTSNKKGTRGITGVNAVGCFAWKSSVV